MTANYVLLEKITVGAAGAASVTFSGIPQTGYTDLKVVISSGQSAANGSNGYYYDVTFNGTSANRSGRYLIGQNGISAVSGVYTLWGVSNPNDFTANTFSNGELYIPNYTSSNFKSASLDSVNENNASTNRLNFSAGLWSDTAAINSITFTPGGGNFIQNSTFYLYGVAKLGTTPAIVPYATGGDTIMTDGTYWYHTFLSSGTFTPQQALSCDYLVVAGGGGGGWAYVTGGGGAGGLRSTVGATGGGGSLESKLSLLSGTGYTVTIGAGGAGSTGSNPGRQGISGSNSTFSTITSTAGGGGGGNAAGASGTDYNGVTGGSGGGAGNNAASVPGSGTTNQGYAGGANVWNGSIGGGGGGGGANAVGAAGSTSGGGVGGAGGAGVTTSISGTSTIYAGGGGGGSAFSLTSSGGSGGGGAGGSATVDAVRGTANTGGGGGGAGGSGAGPNAGGNGGSGIVIVRYAV